MSDTFKFSLVGVGANVQLGKNGNRLVADPSGIRARNADNDALVKMSVLAGTSSIDVVNLGQMETAIGNAIVGAYVNKGSFDASAGNYDAITNPKNGWIYKVSVAGTIGAIAWEVGDNLLVNADVTGHPTASDIQKIDNTEAADILRTGDVSSNADFAQDTTKLASRSVIATEIARQVGLVSSAPAGTVAVKVASLVFGDTSPVNIGSQMIANGRIKSARVVVSTPFNGATESTLMLGHANDSDAICGTSEIDLSTVGIYEIDCNVKVTEAVQYIATYSADGATAGAAEIEIEYSMP